MSNVRDNPAKHRYEIFDDEKLAGFSEYKIARNRIEFTHTEVGPAFSGRGLARELVTEALDDVHRRGLAVLPFCSYVRKVIVANPEQYLDLVHPQDRERFELPDGADGDGTDVRPPGES